MTTDWRNSIYIFKFCFYLPTFLTVRVVSGSCGWFLVLLALILWTGEANTAHSLCCKALSGTHAYLIQAPCGNICLSSTNKADEDYILLYLVSCAASSSTLTTMSAILLSCGESPLPHILLYVVLAALSYCRRSHHVTKLVLQLYINFNL